MARINIEDSLYQDHRFTQLLLSLKDLDRALGVLVRSWTLAQKWYVKSPNRMIPIEEWKKNLIPHEVISTGLAELDSTGEWVKVAGADTQFSWLLQRVEAGRKSGMKRGKQAHDVKMSERIKRNGARTILNRAVVDGKIFKPLHCQDCGATKTIIEGHHSDYSMPLSVDWLCKKCHTETHRNIRQAPDVSFNSVERPLTGSEPSSLTLPLSPSLVANATNSLNTGEGPGNRTHGIKHVFFSSEELIEAIPLITQDLWRKRYRDWDWVKEQSALAFAFHGAEESSEPRTKGAWMKKLHTWLEISWERCGKEKVSRNSLADLDLDAK